MILIEQSAEPLVLADKVLNDCLAHSHPHGVAEVQHVVEWLRLAPLTEVVCLLTLGCSYPKPVEAGGGDATVLSVKKFDPVIELLEVGKMVNMVGGGRTIPLEPNKLGGIEQGSYD